MSLRKVLPPPPPWRTFGGGPAIDPPAEDLAELDRRLGKVESAPVRTSDPQEVIAVNAALCLRRPLLVTGPPGVGKSTLAYQVSRELRLGNVLRWPINSRSTLASGLYEYDAVARVQDARVAAAEPSIGDYLQLGPLGTALLPYQLPRVLLIDEFDKCDPDLANDLLDVLEEGSFQLNELVRARAREASVQVYTADPGQKAEVRDGRVTCLAFPFIVITSNGEREFPPAFLRRCVRLEMPEPSEDRLAELIAAHFAGKAEPYTERIISEFLGYRSRHPVAADQLLSALHLVITGGEDWTEESWKPMLDVVLRRLDEVGKG
ncbi:AAA family ATPase [Nonomuraea sp. NPDC050556]|uniref:AAA family ATPase n=1 Tax=Nonomuraea sp. NPDC050556 TaxID=3364369 RepID=UPI0037A88DD4